MAIRKIEEADKLAKAYGVLSIIVMIFSIVTMTTLGWITFFTFFMITLFIYELKFMIKLSKKMDDIIDILRIMEEGDNYDKRN